MAGYIGKVQIGSNTAVLIGSTLYGISTSDANNPVKTVVSSDDNSGKFINNNYDNLIQGTTIHVKFTKGNTATSSITLQVGTTNQAKAVDGKFICDAGAIISFTLDENEHWVVNDVDNDTQYTFSEGTTNGAFNVSVNGATATTINIHGLGNAAYMGSTTALSSASTNDEFATAASVYSYVQQQTGGLAGLTGAMHFRGIATSAITDGGTESPTISGYDFGTNGANAIAGDVVVYSDKEYVWTADGTNGHWELLGDEGSYALKSSTAAAVNTVTFTANTVPTLTTATVTASKVTITSGTAASLQTTAVSIPNITQAGTPTTASVSGGILMINSGTATVLGTAISVTSVQSFTANSPTVITTTDVVIGSVSNWDAGSAASLTATTTAVVVPS